jgi:D-beta-D-heptose 7-phosphate kinase / D-beta-D-heptose 1-phosphate adenosyltransferase
MTPPALEVMRGIDVLVIGDAMLDRYLLGSSERLCQEAPVPVVDVAHTERLPGGAANVARNVRALGGRARLVALTGADARAATLRDRLHDAGVDVETLVASPRRTTLTKTRLVSDEHLLLRADDGSTDEASAADEAAVIAAVRRSWPTCRAVLVADYGYGTMTDGVVGTLAALHRRDPRVVTIDAKDVRRYRDVGVTASKPNAAQAMRVVGWPPSGVDRAEHLIARADALFDATGADLVATTLDHDGAVALERGRPPYRTYARPTRAATTSGAGDTFAAALTLALAGGAETPAAVEIASAAAAIVVAKERTATCSVDELRVALGRTDKVVDAVRARARIDVERERGRRIVFTNGCFDLLHRGHATYLSRAKSLGDLLVVGVNDDDSMRRIKGADRPINPLEDRCELLSALSAVDLVVPFSERTPERVIAEIRPDVFVKGGDYTVDMLPEAALVEQLGGIVRILPYVEERSTTRLIERIRGGVDERSAVGP